MFTLHRSPTAGTLAAPGRVRPRVRALQLASPVQLSRGRHDAAAPKRRRADRSLQQRSTEASPIATATVGLRTPVRPQEVSMPSGTMTTTSPSHSIALRRGLRVVQYLRDLWRAYWAHRARRASIVLLSSLDDRTLADIGLARPEIESVVREKSRQRLRHYAPDWQ